MERMLKRVGLCSGKRTTASNELDQKHNTSSETRSSNLSNALLDSNKDSSRDSVRGNSPCEVFSSNDCPEELQCTLGHLDGETEVVNPVNLYPGNTSGTRESEVGRGNNGRNDDRRCRKRSRLMFHFQLDSHVLEFRPRALTRRLCGGKKTENELYRSNSFKFERFERKESSLDSLRKQVSLRDEYSIPVDFVNKRPHSVSACLTSWRTFSTDQVEVIETYCEPRDSKAYLQPGDEPSGGKLYTSPNKEYSQPVDEESDNREVGRLATSLSAVCIARPSADEEVTYEALGCSASQKLNEDIDGLLSPETVSQDGRRLSPYYYADLFKTRKVSGERVPECPVESEEKLELITSADRGHHRVSHGVNHFQKQNNLSPTASTPCQRVLQRNSSGIREPSRESSKEEEEVLDDVQGGDLLPTAEDATLLVNVSVSSPGGGGPSVAAVAHGCACLQGDVSAETAGKEEESDAEGTVGGGTAPPAFLAACILRDWDLIFATPSVAAAAFDKAEGVAKDLRTCSCHLRGACIGGGTEHHETLSDAGEEEEEMSGRQRHLYETAFDCKVHRSQDDLDEIDRVSNHPVLRMLPATLSCAAPASISPRSSRPACAPSNEELLLSAIDGKRGADWSSENGASSYIPCSSSKISHEGKPRNRLSSAFQTPPSAKGPQGMGGAPSPPPLRVYTPPSTAPLPAKFHNTHELMNSIQSAPDLPAKGASGVESRGSSPNNQRGKDSKLPIKSLSSQCSTDGPIMEFKGRPKEGEDVRIDVRRGHCKNFHPKKHCENRAVIAGHGARPKYSSTESMATSSSAMSSLESLRSSTSEGNRSTSSSSSRRSSSLSSHSSDSGSTRLLDLHRLHLHHFHHFHHGSMQMVPQSTNLQSGQLHILSPISDKSLEPASEMSDNNRNNNSQGASPEERLCSVIDGGNTENTSCHSPRDASSVQIPAGASDAPQTLMPLRRLQKTSSPQTVLAPTPWEIAAPKLKRRVLLLQNKNLLNRALVQAATATSSSGEAEVQGSDSGISVESSFRGGQCGDGTAGQELRGVPFDMPKLIRRQDASGSSSTSVASTSRLEDLRALPFDMPKLRRRQMRMQPAEGGDGISSSVSQASSSQSVLEMDLPLVEGNPILLGTSTAHLQSQLSVVRPKLTLNLCGSSPGVLSSGSGYVCRKKRPALSLELGCSAFSASGETIDLTIPLERQGWYHGNITRLEAENVLRLQKEGSYLVRNSESARQDYSLSLKSARGFMHMRIQQNKESGQYVLGQFSQPFCTIPDMIQHYTINRLPIKGAEHMCLLHPVIEQLL